MTTLYDFSVKGQDGEEVSLEQFLGKIVLIVNTATACGLTPQYHGLQELYELFKDQGFVILDFPCNQFAGQAPGLLRRLIVFVSLTIRRHFLVLLCLR